MNKSYAGIRFVLITMSLILYTTLAHAQYNVGSLHGIMEPALTLDRQEVNVSLEQISTTLILTNNTSHEIVQTFVLPIPMQISVDGHAVGLQASNRAISNQGKDVSNILNSLGVPYDPIKAMHSIDASPNRESVRNKLISLKLLDKGEETPNWVLKAHYYWRQQFAAGSKTTITQIYKPTLNENPIKIKGNNALIHLPGNLLKKLYNLTVKWTLEDQVSAKNLQSMLEKSNPQLNAYCPSLEDYQVILNSEQQNANNLTNLETKELNYPYLLDEIVCNPANKFSLKIHVPNNMHAMLCWNDALKKSSKNVITFEADHYVPLQNLNILFVAKLDKEVDPG